jgi:glycosyltransferase involved in cell wall biosynthesis
VRVGFYAPLKPPTHPVPSGDRRVAQLIMAALREAGHEIELVSRLRAYDAGDPDRQRRLAALGARLAARAIDRLRRAPPRAMVTYHLHHKAPDWIGPAIANAFAIPYVVIEASVAAKRARGPWELGFRASLDALARADVVVSLNPDDEEGVRAHVAASRMARLLPFLDHRPFVVARVGHGGPPRLHCVAMMRAGDKLESYRVLAAALARVADRAWTLTIVGDGPRRGEVEALMASLGDRVRFVGAFDAPRLPGTYAAHDIFVWPAISEAFGMALLEAQAAGLPAVVGDAGAVATIVGEGETGLLARVGDADAFAAALARLIDDPARARAMGANAAAKIARDHGLARAARALDAILTRVAA